MSTEAEQIVNYLCSYPKGRSRCTRSVAKELLLHDRVMARGYLWDIKAKSVGLGVYEIYLEEAKVI